MAGSDRHVTVREPEGENYFVIGDVITIKLTGSETENAYFIAEVVSQPGGGPWFLHTHEPQETFFVVEGSFEVYGQDANGQKYAIRAEVGDTVHVPGNAPHGFKNVGDKPGRMVLTYEPAHVMLNFFREIGVPMKDRNSLPPESEHLSNEAIMEILLKYMTVIEQPV